MVIVTRSELRKIKSIENKIKQQFIAKKIPTGMEICEIQLYHLANKIKNTEINEEVDNYLPAINDVLQGIDRDELIKKIVSVEFTRFYNYYNKSKDLNTSDSRERGSDSRGNDGSVRYFINVGEKDGYDWMSLKDFLKETLNLGKDAIYKVDVKDTFSFFNTDSDHTDLVLSTFTEFKIDGRFINVEVSKNPGGGRGRRDRDSRRSRGRSGGRDNRGDRDRGDRSRSRRRGASNRSNDGGGSGNRRSRRRDGFY